MAAGRTPVVILSDTFYEFAAPLMAKLGQPTLFCHTLQVDADDRIVGLHATNHRRQDQGGPGVPLTGVPDHRHRRFVQRHRYVGAPPTMASCSVRPPT